MRSIQARGLDEAALGQRLHDVLQPFGRAIGGNIQRLRRVRYWLRQELSDEVALVFMEAVAADRPRNTQIQSITAWQAYSVGDQDLAVSYMSRVLEVRPSDPDALNFIGYSWAERGIRLDEAEQMCRAALEIRPLDGNIQDSLGWVYYQSSQFALAVYWLKSANRLMPDNAVLMDHLADAWLGFGYPMEALRVYRAALEHADDELTPQLIAKIEALEAEVAS